mmetsp:Transcript_6905/g.7369  ORF Transcript_6905/g.7369 Transcript_6905/m.7369 type:complete len:229 (+) Transcript_6905:155-841(+)
MAPIFANDYQTIKGSPTTKDRDDISVGDMTTNGYSIVRSAMLAVIIAIVAVVGVVTFHQSPSLLSNGYESSMSSMALVHEDDGGYSNIDMEAYAKVIATASEDEYGTEMTSSKEDSDSAISCGNLGNLNYQFGQDLFRQLIISTNGCAFFSNGRVAGQIFISFRGQWLGPFILPSSRQYSDFQTINVPGGTITVRLGVSSAGSGRVQIGLRANGASESYVRTGFSQSF